MMSKLYSLLIGTLSVLLIGCNPNVDNPIQPPNPPVLPPTSTTASGPANASDPLFPDSISVYRPQLGSAGSLRQFPFGLANQPATSLKLVSLLLNGKTLRTYQYDQQGRLIQRTDYYTNGIQIFKQFAYSYGINGVITITAQLNKEAPSVEGYPQRSDLQPSATVKFTAPTDSLSRLERTTQTDFAVYSIELGLIRSQLGFSPTGVLVWEETVDETGKSSQYKVFRPDQQGNIVFSRMGSLYNNWQTTQFTFDDKPNPFRTTGDPQSADFGELYEIRTTTNVNNVLTKSTLNSQGSRDNWRYALEYRPDGYPARMFSYRNDELSGIVEFVYNQ